MQKVTIMPGCTTCGACEFIAPEVFEVTDISHVKQGADFAAHSQSIEQAVVACPVSVIMYEKMMKKD